MELIVENDDIITSILEWNIHFLHHKSVENKREIQLDLVLELRKKLDSQVLTKLKIQNIVTIISKYIINFTKTNFLLTSTII